MAEDSEKFLEALKAFRDSLAEFEENEEDMMSDVIWEVADR
jgi:hypothetical protein